MSFKDFQSDAMQQMTETYFGKLLKDKNLTLAELRDALCQEGLQGLENISLGAVMDGRRFKTHTPKHTDDKPVEASVLDKALVAIKEYGDWITAEQLVTLIDTDSPMYVTKVLKEAMQENPMFPVMMKGIQIHVKGRATPHFKYWEAAAS